MTRQLAKIVIAGLAFELLPLSVAPAADRESDATFPVVVEVDAARTRGAWRPVWRFFGADEPNYATMKHGRKLLSELGELSPDNVYFRAHNLLTSGDGTPALKWGSTGVYREDDTGFGIVASFPALKDTPVISGKKSESPGRETAEAARPERDGDYELVWSDEFEKDGPPSARNWDYERGFVRNKELQWYRPENARCEKGMLVIEARRERVRNPSYGANRRDWKGSREAAEYTSASLRTRGLHAWTYGRFEMRGRIDVRPGLWPAFWTLGSARAWPGCGEIDIMEFYRGKLLANAAWASGQRWKAVWDDVKKPIGEFGDPDWANKFHVWRMDWDANEIRLYVDDVLLNSIDLEKTVNRSRDRANPFREPHTIILNLAIGGTQGGDPSRTVFPARFEVDYVRVYQKPARTPEPTRAKGP